jgi:hypothetical protein
MALCVFLRRLNGGVRTVTSLADDVTVEELAAERAVYDCDDEDVRATMAATSALVNAAACGFSSQRLTLFKAHHIYFFPDEQVLVRVIRRRDSTIYFQLLRCAPIHSLPSVHTDRCAPSTCSPGASKSSRQPPGGRSTRRCMGCSRCPRGSARFACSCILVFHVRDSRPSRCMRCSLSWGRRTAYRFEDRRSIETTRIFCLVVFR